MTYEVPSTPKPVVTLFESYGSGANYVGPKVAEALGVKWLGQRFSSDELEAAKKATDDDLDGPFDRFMKAFGMATTETMDQLFAAADQRSDYDTVLDNNKTIWGAVREGGVVLGRSATVVLQALPTALHVKLDGAVDKRVARAAQDAGITEDRARRRQVHEDEIRAAMSMRLYNWDPRKNDRYDLVINTGQVSLDAAVDMIVAAAKAKFAAAAKA